VVTGTFEYVNQEQLALSLVVPKKYEGPDFPVITLVAPSRAVTIQRLPLRINGKYSALKDESLVNTAPGPKLGLSGSQFFEVNSGQITAHLSGQFLTDIEVRLNGVPCGTAQEGINDDQPAKETTVTTPSSHLCLPFGSPTNAVRPRTE
jgi:hypothetical protein